MFDQVNHRAVAAMQANRLETIREFTNEQRRATSLALVSGVEAGLNPREQARNFRDSIGLTEKQWKAVANYRAILDKVGTGDAELPAFLTTTNGKQHIDRALRDGRFDGKVRAAIKANKPLSQADKDRMVTRYTERYVKYRSEVIGRTEALRAVHQGTREMYQQAIDAGTIEESRIERKWVTRLDGRERKTHRFLSGQKRGFNEPWVTENGAIMFPGDPNAPAAEVLQCRCATTHRLRLR